MRPRRPRIAHRPRTERRASTGGKDPDRDAEGCLTWRLARVDFEGDWGWSGLGSDDLVRLKRVLSEYERTPYHALRAQERIKEIPVSDICEGARDRLEAIEQSDVDSICELRLGVGDWRVWGLLSQLRFDIVWWDPHHTVCTGPDRARSRRLPFGRRR